MAEIQPNDIGLATFADVGEVANLKTAAKEIVAAINEVFENGGSANLGEQLYCTGEDNAVIGGGNIIHGSGNRVFGSGNIIIGDNHLIIGSNKTITAGFGDVSFDWVDTSLKRVYFYIYTEDNVNFHIQAGDRVVMSVYQSWCDPNWTDWISMDTGKFFTTVTEVNMGSGYIAVADMPITTEPPDSVHTVLDYMYVSNFYVLRDEYKKNGNGSVTMGYASTGSNSFSANYGTASGSASAAFNSGSATKYSAFAANSGYVEGSYAFASNQGRSYSEYAAALNGAYAYSGYSCALNCGRTCGRAIKCVSINSSAGSVTADIGENVSGLVGTLVLVRYKNNWNTIIYNTKTVSSVSGQTIYFAEGFGGSGYSLMPDGYVFRVESSYGYNLATGYAVAGNRYSQAHGNNTLAAHEGAAICGRYGVSPADYSWSLANGTAFTNMGLAVKILQSGDIAADGTFSSPCADYAEFFEWQDGNSNNEDRAGYFVKLSEDKIVKCGDFDTPLGVVSATPAIIGDSGELHWQGKFMTDDFGRVLFQDVTIPAEKDEKGNVLIEEHTERQPILNPAWDSAQEYVPRQSRSEWATVGVLGKLIVYDDGTLQGGDLCRCGTGGKAVKSISNGYCVLKRVSEDKVLIWFKG